MNLVTFIDLLSKNNFIKGDDIGKHDKCYWMINISERAHPDKWEDFNLFEVYQIFIFYKGFAFTRSVDYISDFDFLYSTYEFADGIISETKNGTYEKEILSVDLFQKFFLKNIDLFTIDENSAIIIHPAKLFAIN